MFRIVVITLRRDVFQNHHAEHDDYFQTRPAQHHNINMFVGTLRVRLLVRGARSLKDKRQVVRSVTDRLRHQYNVSVNEVDARDDHRLIVLGLAMVNEESSPIRGSLERIQETLRAHPVAEYLSGELDVFSV